MKIHTIRRFIAMLVMAFSGLTATMLVLAPPVQAASPDHLSPLLLSATDTGDSAPTSLPGLRPAEMTEDYVNFIALNELKHGNQAQTGVALTFDCGGDAKAIKNILATLKAGGAQGTFFLEGKSVEEAPEIVPLILAGRHEVANHSYSHPRFTTLTQTQVISELAQTEALISAAAGRPVPMRYFRFPYGDRNQDLRNWIAQQGYQSVFWDVDAQGWRNTITATEVISFVLNTARPGSIVLMHCNAVADQAALLPVISGLQAQGYQLGTLSEVAEEKEPKRGIETGALVRMIPG